MTFEVHHWTIGSMSVVWGDRVSSTKNQMTLYKQNVTKCKVIFIERLNDRMVILTSDLFKYHFFGRLAMSISMKNS